MSELNDAIKPILIANGFEEVDGMPFAPLNNLWDYRYSNGEYYIYFDKEYMIINARYNNGNLYGPLYNATAEDVIAYFTEHGKAPIEETKQDAVPLGQQMWDYLLSVGFEVINKYDIRLRHNKGNWEYNIAKGNLCAFSKYLDVSFIYFMDGTSYDSHIARGVDTDGLRINSVADLQAWLQHNGYLDDASANKVSPKTSVEQEATKNTEHSQQLSPQQLDIIKTALQEKLARAVQVQVDIEATLKAIEGCDND